MMVTCPGNLHYEHTVLCGYPRGRGGRHSCRINGYVFTTGQYFLAEPHSTYGTILAYEIRWTDVVAGTGFAAIKNKNEAKPSMKNIWIYALDIMGLLCDWSLWAKVCPMSACLHRRRVRAIMAGGAWGCARQVEMVTTQPTYPPSNPPCTHRNESILWDRSPQEHNFDSPRVYGMFHYHIQWLEGNDCNVLTSCEFYREK